ncbi:glycosyltransferase involved in cell wall biosynthesis [Lachnospiraceae bacterium PF1-21]|uniref:glycosyltransferase family 2 protein n=1 Tax=Ohessyouella blattaphilus TaxID=2949333 RepID=UPI003E2A9216
MNNTSINNYLEWIKNTIDKRAELSKFAHEYLERERGRDDDINEPFLSVITRTTGQRIEMLSEVLLCLSAQTNQNFEVLVMGHNLSYEAGTAVEGAINDFPIWFRTKVELHYVNGGTRTTPLKEGFEKARGSYIVILDDDDLVFDNWVEEFYTMSRKSPGTMLHSYMLAQEWDVVDVNGHQVPRANGTPDAVYCREFQMENQLVYNNVPQGSVAYPAFAYKEWGIRFDESLTTTEDWDFLMRTAFLTGVYDGEVATCIYRKWINMDNSASIHDIEEWNENYKKIRKKFANIPIVMPISYSDTIGNTRTTQKYNGDIIPAECTLYVDDGTGFSEEKTIVGVPGIGNKRNTVFFHELLHYGKINYLRFDPMERGQVYIYDLVMRIVFEDNSEISLTDAQMLTNGVRLSKGTAFLNSDPQMTFGIGQDKGIKFVSVKFKQEVGLRDEIIEEMKSKQNWRSSFLHKKLLRKVKRQFLK